MVRPEPSTSPHAADPGSRVRVNEGKQLTVRYTPNPVGAEPANSMGANSLSPCKIGYFLPFAAAKDGDKIPVDEAGEDDRRPGEHD